MQDRPTFGALSNQGLCHLCSVANRTKSLSENKCSNKKQLFGLRRKPLSYSFHLWENVYYRNFIQFSVRMELYGIVWKDFSHLWELYDKHFWSNRVPWKSSWENRVSQNQSATKLIIMSFCMISNLTVLNTFEILCYSSSLRLGSYFLQNFYTK